MKSLLVMAGAVLLLAILTACCVSEVPVSFDVERIATREYRFIANQEAEYYYYEWKFYKTMLYWYGYVDDNKASYQYENSGYKEVTLRIFDAQENLIGTATKKIYVH